MSLTDQFLEQYKSLETMLRYVYGSGTTALSYEEKSVEPEKLRICRLVRNFLQHTPDGTKFLVPTEAMCNFLRNECLRIAAQAERAADLMYRQSPVKLSHTLQQAARLFLKADRGWLPVVDDKSRLVGALTKDALFARLASGKNISTVHIYECFPARGWPKTLENFLVRDVEKDLAGCELKQVILTRKGKYSGIFDVR